jgi:ABC-type multidrug transport system permease subunit
VKNGGEAGGLSWIAILPIQFLCNVMFNLGDSLVVRLDFATYGVRAIQNVIVRGLGWMDIWMDLLVDFLFGVGFIIIGLVIFQKKSQV